MTSSARRGNRLSVLAALALVVVLLVGVLLAKPAHAETFTVNSTNHPGTGVCDATECTLKEAINEANTNGESDTIGFASGLGGEIELSNASAQAGGFVIQNDTQAEDVRIEGPGAGVLAIDGNGQVRPFEIYSGANATIEGLTIKHGFSSSSGGGGSFSDYGGGIHNSGVLTLTDSNLSGNSTSAFGGGIFTLGTMKLIDSTLSGNSADPYGGGIFNLDTLTVTNSTLSGNTATTYGGGIYNQGTMTMTNSTLSGNSSSSQGGGIYGYLSSVLGNTIVAGNSSPTGPDVYGRFTSQGYNLIGDTSDSSGWVSTDLLDQGALLGPLQNNGGSTHTHALKPNSPAINAIPTGTNGCSTTIPTDQTGTKRPQGLACDIGSYENKSPRVKGVSPKGGATDVGVGAKVRAFFSQGIKRASVSADTFKLYKLEGTTTTPVAAQVSYDALKKVAILTPSAPLEAGATYRAVVTTAVTDLAGNRLDQDRDPSNGNQRKVWRFTVRN